MKKIQLFLSLKNPIFARLYLAQTISLLGDALTWVGLALLSFELAPQNSGVVLSVALTLRITAFVLLSPLAGALADRFDRKVILVATHLVRMVIICLLPLVTQVWQLYGLVFALNCFNAFFTPTYQATIPLVTGKKDYSEAIALSSATYQLLGVLGPGVAGSVAAFLGARQVFFLDGLSFLVAAILILSIPNALRVEGQQKATKGLRGTWEDIKQGSNLLFADSGIRYALLMQLVASVAGAQILVNTVGYVKNILYLGSQEYGWVMAAFGIGATTAALVIGMLNKGVAKTFLVLSGAMAISVALIPANYVGLTVLLLLWFVAGAGQTIVNVPTQTLIADRISFELQGRVYGAHFAWSHLWWGFSYPLAGWLGNSNNNQEFLVASAISLTLLVLVQLIFSPQVYRHIHDSFWHEHSDEHQGNLANPKHSHLHLHSGFEHSHFYVLSSHQHHH